MLQLINYLYWLNFQNVQVIILTILLHRTCFQVVAVLTQLSNDIVTLD